MKSRYFVLALSIVATLAACVDPNTASRLPSSRLSLRSNGEASRAEDPAVRREYGPAVRLGEGLARTYVAFNPGNDGNPVELGVALSENAMSGLPAPMNMSSMNADPHAHVDFHEYILALPEKNNTPFKFVELDWNPGGHEPPGVYDIPHFDFHFYTVDKSVRDGIDPVKLGQDAYLAMSGKLPPEDERPKHYAALSAPGTPVMAVPRMGTHWVDLRTPELQAMFGKPEAYLPFTTTFLRGSWDGRMIFWEPMITRAFIMQRKAATKPTERDLVIELPESKTYSPSGYYPKAYRIMWDGEQKEYRIALTQLVRR
jgi:hypothetical protein